MNRILFAILVAAGAFLPAAGIAQGAEYGAAGPPTDISHEDNCPESVWEARRCAAADTTEFRRSHPMGTWTGFLHVYRSKHEFCPHHIRRAYLDEARGIIEASPMRYRWQTPR